MRQRWIEFTIGIFVAVAAGLVLVMVVTMGSRMLRDDYKVTAYFQNVAGLGSGVGVRMAGFRIGDVTKIRFMTPDESRKVGREGVWLRVEMRIDKRYPIAKDAELLLNPQLVLGEVYLDVTTGSSSEYLPRDGSAVIEKTQLCKTDVEAAVEEAVEKFNDLAGQLDSFFGSVKDLLAFLGREDLREDVSVTISHVRSISRKTAEAMDDFELLMAETHGLVMSGQQAFSQVNNLAVSADKSLIEFKKATERIEKKADKGLATLEGAKTDLGKASSEFTKLVNSVNKSVDKREGTVGLLLRSPALHDDAREAIVAARDALVRLEATAASIQRAAAQMEAAAVSLKRHPSSVVWGRKDKPEAVSASGQTIGANDIGID